MPQKPNEFDRGVQFVKEHIPGFEVGYKNENLWSKILGVLVWIFNRKYMTEYTTTRYPRVFFPSREFVAKAPRTAFKILMHEFVHLWDRREQGFWKHVGGYGFPQIFAVVTIPFLITALCVPAPADAWIKWVCVGVAALLSAAALCPLPAPFRTRIEMRGYGMNMALNFWKYDSFVAGTLNWIAKYFYGPQYYFMWPFKLDVLDRLHAIQDLIATKAILSEDFEGGSPSPFVLVHDLWREMELDK